jgi:gliding motility-associated-like protein
VNSACDSGYNVLNWSYLRGDCAEGIVKYRIYYSPLNVSVLALLDSTRSRNDTVYIHRPSENTLAGCYYVTAVDSFNNESLPSSRVCVDQCIYYNIPNVFTPDGDGIDDILHPFPYRFVDHIDLKIFSRWGQTVYETSDPDINWNGKYKNTDNYVSPGVYWYICDVYEKRLSGMEVRNVTGFIHVFSSEKSTKTTK